MDVFNPRRISPLDILRASPFDHERNMGGALDENIFYKHLFYEDKKYKYLSDKIISRFWGDIDRAPFIILHGFSGTGKTTFLRSFAKNNYDNFSCKVLDFHVIPGVESDQREALEIIKTEHELDQIIHSKDEYAKDYIKYIEKIQDTLYSLSEYQDPITRAMRHILININYSETIEALEYIKMHRAYFDSFFSARFFDKLNSVYDASDQNAVAEFLAYLLFTDSFMLFIYRVYRRAREGRKYLICFDNLDTIGVEYLSEYFFKIFTPIQKKAAILASKSDVLGKVLDFRANFRFLFALREANREAANKHIEDSVGQGHVLDYVGSIDESMFKKIYLKRIHFIQCYCRKSCLKIDDINVEALKIIIEKYLDDFYFEKVFIPLFNYDIKKFVEFIYSLASEPIPDVLSCEKLGYSYGIRGRFVFFVTKKLKSTKFLKAWFKEIDARAKNKQICSGRLLLTVLINSCAKSPTVSYRQHIAASHCSLKDYIASIQGTIEDEAVFDGLIDAFLCHETDWVGLISFRNKLIKQKNDLNAEKEALRIARSRMREKNILDYDDPELEEVLLPLTNVEIKYNPSTFVFIRYIIVHFEFYSAMIDEEGPLFGVGLKKASPNKLGYVYDFERKIDQVYKFVSEQNKKLKGLCGSWYFDVLGYDHESFRKSQFCFKHVGEGGYAQKGVHHPVRVITQHIDYIDKFRQNILNHEMLANEEKNNINRRLCLLLEKYVSCLNFTTDTMGQDFARQFNLKINMIKASSYNDFQTEMTLRRF